MTNYYTRTDQRLVVKPQFRAKFEPALIAKVLIFNFYYFYLVFLAAGFMRVVVVI